VAINFSVRWADNTKEFVRNMKEGLDQIEVNRAAVEKLANSLAGNNVVKSANNWAAALKEVGGEAGALGGVLKLSNAEVERAIGVFDRAIAKANAMGKADLALVQTYREMSEALHKQKDEYDALDVSQKKVSASGQSLSGVFGNINIKQALSDPLSAATQGMHALAGSMGGTAVVAAGAVTGLAAIGTAIYGLASKAAAAGAALDDMADKTGLSVPALSKLSNASKVIGADMNQLTDVIFKLERGIGENTDAFQAGLKAIGLSTAELKSAGPDRYLELVSAGLAGLEDPTARAVAGNAILGKGFKDVAAALQDLDAGFKLTADIHPWTKDQAKEAEQFEQQMKSLVIHAEAFSVAVGRDLIGPISAFTSHLGTMGSVLSTVTGFDSLIDQLHLVGEAFNWAAAAANTFRDASKMLPSAPSAPKLATNPFVVPTIDEHVALGHLEADYKKIAEAQKKAAEEQKRYSDAVASYNSTDGPQYEDILNKIGNDLYEGIAFDKARGKSTSDLVLIYKTTATVIDQITRAEEAYKKKLSEVTAAEEKHRKLEEEIAAIIKAQTIAVNKDVIAGLDARLKAQDAYDREVHRLTMTEDDFQRSEIALELRREEERNKTLVGNAKATSDLIIATLKLRLDAIGTLWKQSDHEMFPKKIKDEAKNNIDELGSAVERLGRQIGGAMGDSTFAIGSFIREFKKAASEADKIAAATEGGLAVAAALVPAGSRAANSIKYAQAGASIGTAIAPGYGTLVGAGVGAVVGALKVPDDEKAARQQLNDFKKQLADLFDTTASASLKAAVGTDAWGKMVEQVKAAYIATGRTAEEALADINTAADHTRNNVEMLPDGLAKINKILQQTLNFGPQAMASASAVGLIDKSFLDLLNHAKELKGVTQSMKDFVAAQTDAAGAGFDRALKVGNDAYAKRKDLLEQIAALGTSDADKAKLADLNKQLETQNKLIDAVGIHSQQAADAVAGGLLAVINSQIMAGKSFHDSVVAIGPSVDALSEQMIAAGYSGSAAFDFLRAQVALVNDEVAGPALDAVEGYAAGLRGLNNAGLLNQDMFAGLSSQIGQTRDALVAQGKDGAQVMAAMRGPLQTLWELEQKFGYTTDDATQALIDQAEAAGEVGEKFKPIGEQMLDATNRIADAVEGLAEVFGVLPKAAKDAATGISDELKKIKTPTITIPVGFLEGDTPPPDLWPVPKKGPGYASGTIGLKDFGSGQWAMLHGKEEVRTEAQVRAAETITTNNNTSSTEASTTLVVVNAPAGATQAQITDLVIAALPEKVKRNTRGLRSDLLASLGQPVTTWTR